MGSMSILASPLRGWISPRLRGGPDGAGRGAPVGWVRRGALAPEGRLLRTVRSQRQARKDEGKASDRTMGSMSILASPLRGWISPRSLCSLRWNGWGRARSAGRLGAARSARTRVTRGTGWVSLRDCVRSLRAYAQFARKDRQGIWITGCLNRTFVLDSGGEGGTRWMRKTRPR